MASFPHAKAGPEATLESSARSTELSEPSLFLFELDLELVNLALDRSDLLSRARLSLLRAVISPHLFAAGPLEYEPPAPPQVFDAPPVKLAC